MRFANASGLERNGRCPAAKSTARAVLSHSSTLRLRWVCKILSAHEGGVANARAADKDQRWHENQISATDKLGLVIGKPE
jgi:hypothetical protein